MELSPPDGCDPVEDEVKTLNLQNGAETSDCDGCDRFRIIERNGQSSSSNESELNSPISTSNSQSPSCYPSQCGHKNQGKGFVLTSCKHATCGLCLKSQVESVVEKSVLSSEHSYEDIRILLQCPSQRCGMELSKGDLINLLDIGTLERYENWLRTAYRNLYDPIFRPKMVTCIKCPQGSAIKYSRNSSTKTKGKEKDNDDVNQLQSAVSNKSIQFSDSLVCVNCGLSWCAACGFAFDSQCKESESDGGHACCQATNYIISNTVVDLEVIFDQYTTRTIKFDDQPDTTSSDKNLRRTAKIEDQPGTSASAFKYLSTGNDLELILGKMKGLLKKMMKSSRKLIKKRKGIPSLTSKPTEEKVRKVEKELDCMAEVLLKTLVNILRNKAANRLQPVLGFSAYILLGDNNVVGEFLQFLVMNDSMLDICARSALYLQLAELLKTMAQYPELLKMLIDRRPSLHSHGYNGNDSLVMKKLKNIYEQSNIMVSRFGDENGEENVKAEIGIARSLIECYEKLASAVEKQTSPTVSMISVSVEDDSRMAAHGQATSAHSTSTAKEDGSKNMEDTKVSSDHCRNASLYKESLKPFQFGEYSFTEKDSCSHTYSKLFNEPGTNLQSIDKTGVHNKNRMLHITKEIASLATNLPLELESSIHVRVDTTRMDLLKALIIGPKGTPYQNGVFIFDIYLPPDYPQVPPLVKFLTTGCGTVRFNPNLYSTGSVCLSLLGTWEGPGWEPGKSTLLQVLVSIQSLIFVEDPYYNEPGRQPLTNLNFAEEENRNLRLNTLDIAILRTLKQPDSSFKDVIVTHFLHKKDEIINQCNAWIAASGGPQHHLYRSIVWVTNELIIHLVSS